MPSSNICQRLSYFSATVTSPGPLITAAAPIGLAGMRKLSFPGFVNITLGAAPTTFQISPADVADIRVKPPTPSIDRASDADTGALAKTY